MADSSQHREIHNQRMERFKDVLRNLAEKGINQTEISRRTGIPPQYISDVKSGSRNVSELFARRISEEFGYDLDWLLGKTTSPASRPALPPRAANENRMILPLLPHPVKGLPEASSSWTGELFEVCGLAAIAATKSDNPYVLKFGRTDPLDALQKGDLLLISQSPKEDASIGIVGKSGKYFLARRNSRGKWQRIAPGSLPPNSHLIGHCVGLLWRTLERFSES